MDATQFAGTVTAYEAPAFLHSQLLADQVSVADVLVGSKADRCDEKTLRGFRAWAQDSYPPKTLVTTAVQGHVSPDVAGSLLAWPAGSGATAAMQHGWPTVERQQDQHDEASSENSRSTATKASTAAGCPYWRHEVQSDGSHAACGWVFDSACQFDRPRLLAFLQHLVPGCSRLKGVFRVGPTRWEAASSSASTLGGGLGVRQQLVELKEVSYRRDSRMEIILSSGSDADADEDHCRRALAAAAAGDWQHVEALLLSTLQLC